MWSARRRPVAGAVAFVLALLAKALAAVALWGLYCIVVVWTRVAQKRFRSEEEQDEFLDALEEPLAQGDFDEAEELLDLLDKLGEE